MPLRSIIGRPLQLNANSGIQLHELLQLLLDERSLSAERRSRKGENRLIGVGSSRAPCEQPRGEEEGNAAKPHVSKRRVASEQTVPRDQSRSRAAHRCLPRNESALAFRRRSHMSIGPFVFGRV